MHATVRCFCFGLLLLIAPGCVFHSSARSWNERKDPAGNPVYYVSTTKVGLNLLVLIPFLGDLAIDGLVNDVTSYIEEKGGNGIRVVQAGSENYWYGWSPLTWILSPVVANVAVEYQPTPAEVAEQQQLEAEEEQASGSKWYRPWSW